MALSLERIRELRALARNIRGKVVIIPTSATADELDEALAAAEALAQLEAWTKSMTTQVRLGWNGYLDEQFDVKVGHWIRASGPTLLAAIAEALEKAEAKP